MPTISNMTKIAKIAKDNPELLQTLKASGNLKNLGNITSSNSNIKKKDDSELIIEKPDTLLQPWKDTVILKSFEDIMANENCLSGETVPNTKVDSQTGPEFKNVFWTAYYSISELPIFGWSEARHTERTDEHGSIEKHLFPSTLKKFIFCFFKLTIGYPLYALNIVARLFLIIFGPLIRLFKMIGIGLVNTGSFLGNSGKAAFTIPEYIKTENGKKIYEKTWTPTAIEIWPSYFGMIFPLHLFDKKWGEDYGKGELTIFIIIVMAISAILITLTGINIAVILGVFVYFLFKTLMGVRETVVGIDLRKGGDKSN